MVDLAPRPVVGSAEQGPLSWVIVGGGPQGVHIAVRLIAEAGVRAEQLCIVDPGAELLEEWRRCTASTGMRFLRSPSVHHLDVEPFALLRFAGTKRRSRRGRGLFLGTYKRPALDFFARHCAAVIERYGLAPRHVQGRVAHVGLEETGARLTLESGRVLRAENVVLAIGNADRPRWPEPAAALREAGGRVVHLFSPDGPLEVDALPAEVVVLGGGISAAQVALRLADSGRQPTVLARHDPREHEFDSDPGWIGPRYMRSFLEVQDWAQRRAIITAARHVGSMPSDVHRELRVAMDEGRVRWLRGALTGGAVREGGALELELDDGAAQLPAGALVVATGFLSGRPGGALTAKLIEEHALPVAPCGFPVVDTALQWAPGLFVAGPLAELELGPTARNITGGRRAAERIVAAVRAQNLGRGATAASAPERPRALCAS